MKIKEEKIEDKNSEIRRHAKTFAVPIIRTQSHLLLKQKIKEQQPKHILEIGTAIGFSAIAMLEECDGDLITIEHNKEYIKQAKKNLKKARLGWRAKIASGDCLVVLANMVASGKYDGYFDFVFLDGPKAQYHSMFELLMILLKSGGTIVVDDVLFRGYVEGETKAPTKRFKTIIKRLADFIELCKTSEKLKDFELINLEDGIIVAKRV